VKGHAFQLGGVELVQDHLVAATYVGRQVGSVDDQPQGQAAVDVNQAIYLDGNTMGMDVMRH
jgi:hypothetical protein